MATNATAPVPWWQAGDLPAESPPPGLSPDFINAPSLHVYGIVTQSLCPPSATILILIQLYTKTNILRNNGWDNYTSVLVWLGLILVAVLSFVQDKHGFGEHLWDVKGDDFTKARRILYVSQIM